MHGANKDKKCECLRIQLAGAARQRRPSCLRPAHDDVRTLPLSTFAKISIFDFGGGMFEHFHTTHQITDPPVAVDTNNDSNGGLCLVSWDSFDPSGVWIWMVASGRRRARLPWGRSLCDSNALSHLTSISIKDDRVAEN